MNFFLSQSNLDSFFSSTVHRNYNRSLNQQYQTLNFVVMRHQRRISFLLSSPKKSSPSSAELSTSIVRCVLTTFFVCSPKNVFCFTHSSPWWFNSMLSTSRTFGGGGQFVSRTYNWWLPPCQTPPLPDPHPVTPQPVYTFYPVFNQVHICGSLERHSVSGSLEKSCLHILSCV